MHIQKMMTALAAVALLSVPEVATAQTTEHEQHHPQGDAASPQADASSGAATPGTAASAGEVAGSGGPMTEGQMMGSDMMGSGMSGMMGPDMMRMMHRMMGEGMAGPMRPGAGPIVVIMPVPVTGDEAMPGGMMRPGMMRPGMMDMMRGSRDGMMPGGPARMGAGGGSADLTVGVVKPAMHLSAADVRDHLEHRLERIGNPRLAVGDVTEADDDTIAAEIVTADGSLVDRLQVDRHSGVMERMP